MKKLGLLCGAFAVAASMGAAEAKTLKLQASSKSGDWAHRFMSETWAPKLNAMTGPDGVKIEVLPTKAVVPHRETIDAVANGILDGDLNAVCVFFGPRSGVRDHGRPDRRL